MKKPQLFMLHFAGGTCYSYQFMSSLLKEFDVVTPELPGRGKRMGEPLIKNFDAAADDMFAQVSQKITSPTFLIYGHSMGAYLALRVANMLEKTGKVPASVIVSGNSGPRVSERESKKRYLMETPALKEELIRIGGVPVEVLEHEELFGLFEPILRADFEVAENHHMENEPATGAPLFAMMGSEEEHVDNISNWGRFTKARFQHEILPGDHFFIHKQARRIATIIRNCYEEALMVRQ
jgi:surfactin synthase thioesterase subunit